MKILCGTDFSAQAERASRAAIQLARRFGDSVVLAHVLEPPTSNLIEIGADARRFEQALREAAERALDDAAASLRSYGVGVETVFLRGAGHEALTTYAREIKARLIVLGSHGRRAPWRWFVGSVAERTQRLAECPVLIVREHEEGIGEWAGGHRPLRVLVGIDMSEASHAPVAFVRELRKKGPCHIDFVHASRPFAFQPAADVVALLDRALREQIGKLEGAGDVTLRVVPNWNTDADTLVRFADAEKVDLIVVGTHQRRGLDLLTSGSVAREVVRVASLPVLTVPTVVRVERAPVETPRLATVLVPTDLSERGNRAVPWGYAMTRPGGRVVLCHIAAAAGDEEKIERRLRELAPVDALARGIATQVVVRAGDDPAAVIGDIAVRMGADALCTSSAKHLPCLPDVPVFVMQGGSPRAR